MYYIKCKDLEERTSLAKYLRDNEIVANFHYIPLHSAPAGLRYGRFSGADEFTTKESERLLRMPMYYGLTREDIGTVVRRIEEYYEKR